jgi:integral membrane protein
MLRTPVGRLRALGMIEAVSFLLLVGVAMPLKYFADLPLAVKIAGWLHGMLFLAFCMLLLQTQQTQN